MAAGTFARNLDAKPCAGVRIQLEFMNQIPPIAKNFSSNAENSDEIGHAIIHH